MFDAELVGYVGSVLVATSLMMVRIVRLRIVNLCGAFTFAGYGFLIGSWPVAGMNAFIVGINVYHLWHLVRQQECFQVVEVEAASLLLRRLLEHFRADIQKTQPSFADETAYNFARLILRNGRLAGCIVAHHDSDKKVLKVILDYALPEFQDFKTGRFFYNQLTSLAVAASIKRVETLVETTEHARYLEQMGFTGMASKEGWMELKLDAIAKG